MFVPGHYVALFAMLFIAESVVIFIYTTIGLVKQNPMPWMVPPQPVPYQYPQLGECYHQGPIMRGSPMQSPEENVPTVITVTSISTVTQSATQQASTLASTNQVTTTIDHTTTVQQTLTSDDKATATQSDGVSSSTLVSTSDGSTPSARDGGSGSLSSTRSSRSAEHSIHVSSATSMSSLAGVAYLTSDVTTTVQPLQTSHPLSTTFLTVFASAH